MAVAALKQRPRLKSFYATMHVTRLEEWFVEAETAEGARELLLKRVLVIPGKGRERVELGGRV
jgi:hypothetical protein